MSDVLLLNWGHIQVDLVIGYLEDGSGVTVEDLYQEFKKRLLADMEEER